MHDPDSGDLIVTYRVPYKDSGERPATPVTSPPPLSRRARRAAAKQGQLEGSVLPFPPNASHEALELTGRILRLLAKHAPDKTFRLPASLAAEQRALACITVATNELSSMPPSPQRQAIITQMGVFLSELVSRADEGPAIPGLSDEDLEQAAKEGFATRIDLGPDDTDKPH